MCANIRNQIVSSKGGSAWLGSAYWDRAEWDVAKWDVAKWDMSKGGSARLGSAISAHFNGPVEVEPADTPLFLPKLHSVPVA